MTGRSSIENAADPDVMLEAAALTKEFRVYRTPWAVLARMAGPTAGKKYRTKRALSGVSFTVKRGECMGVMGANGAGKTTLLRIIARALYPSGGSLYVGGRSVMLDVGSSMNPHLTGRDNLLATGLAIGIPSKELMRRFDAMLEFSELGVALDDPLKTYSAGMVLRLAFSLYAFLDPDVLIIDEAFAVGDARFILKCTQKIRQLKARGAAIILASHDANAIRDLADHAILLDEGRLYHAGTPIEVVEGYHALLGLTKDRSIQLAGEGALPVEREKLLTVTQFLSDAIKPTQPSFHSQEVQILGAKVYRNGKASSGVFEYGDECRVDWLIHANRTVPCLTSGIHVHSKNGTYVFGTSYIHLDEGLQVEAGGFYVLSISFSLNIGPGHYVLSIGAAEPDVEEHASGGVQLDRFLYVHQFELLNFGLSPNEPIPFFGITRLPARAAPALRVAAD